MSGVAGVWKASWKNGAHFGACVAAFPAGAEAPRAGPGVSLGELGWPGMPAPACSALHAGSRLESWASGPLCLDLDRVPSKLPLGSGASRLLGTPDSGPSGQADV